MLLVKREVKFLGHIVSYGGLRKSEEFVSAVQNFPQPVTVKQFCSFLLLVNFQRNFIAECAILVKPLTALTCHKDSFKLEWTEELLDSFNSIKDAVCADIELCYPNYDPGAPKLELSADASGVGAGACLSQLQEGKQCVVAYASMCFSKAQRNYSTIE